MTTQNNPNNASTGAQTATEMPSPNNNGQQAAEPTMDINISKEADEDGQENVVQGNQDTGQGNAGAEKDDKNDDKNDGN